MPIHFLFPNIFPKRKFSETQKGSSTKCFGTVRWNHFDAQSWRPPPFLSLLFFDFKTIWKTERSLFKKFRYYETKKVDGESWCPPTFFSLTFFQKKISETQKGSSTKYFGTVRWNHSDAQSRRPPPLLSLLFFDFKKIWTTERSLYENFRYLRPKKVDGESWCPPTFFSLTISDIKRILKHRRVHLRNVWVLWDKNFQRKIVKPLPLLCKKNFDCKTSETQKGSPTKFSGTVSQKNWRGSWCPPALFSSTFFNIKNFLKHRRLPLRIGSLLGNKHRSTVVIPRPFLSSTFSPSGKLSETQKGSLTKSFGTVKQNSLTENPDTPTPLMHEKFLNQIFSETMKASLRNVSIQRDKKFLGQSWCPPTFFSLTFFQKIISETQKGSSTKCFGTVRWNHFDAQSWRPPPFLSLFFFDFKKIWNTERSLYESFGTMRSKKSTENRDVYPLSFP